MKNYSKMLFVTLLGMILCGSAGFAQTITQWNFDQESLTPSTGAGTAANIGGTSTAWAGGNPADGRGWNTSAYPAQGVGSGTAGAQFNVSTAGYENIVVSWDNRHSNTAANRVRLQYTLNGTTWVNFEASAANATNTQNGEAGGFDNGRYVSTVGAVWYSRSADFSAIAGASNNPNFAVRMVTEFADGQNYVATADGSSYGPSGTIRFDNVTFSGGAGTSPLLAATPSSLSGFTYLVGAGPSAVQTTSISGSNLNPASGVVTVTAPTNYEVSLNGTTFGSSINFNYTGGTLAASTIHVRLKAGLAAGSYSETLTITGGGAPNLSVSLAGSVSSGLEPGFGTVIVPRYMEGSVPTNPTRVPFAFHATLVNLLPNATYRYYNRVVLESDGPTYTGAGNVILVSSSTATFERITSPGLSTQGTYGEFTTTANGSYSGWFMIEPTANASRFKPGTELHMRIILNDGNGGTTESIFLTTAESVRVLAFRTSAADTSGTAVRGVSDFSAKNFIFLYDNTAGTGRPLYGTQIESSGIPFATAGNYAPFYLTDVAGQAGAWGGIIPNMNPNGVMRIEERNIANGNIVNTQISNDGRWGATDTRNPSGGIENVLVINTTVGIPVIPVHFGKIYTYGNVLNVELNNNSRANLQIINLQGKLMAEYQITSSKESIMLNVPAGVYLVKIAGINGTYSQKVLVR